MDLQVIISMMIWICSFMGINPVTDLPTVVEASPNTLSKVCKVDVPGCYQRPMIYLRNDLTPAQKEYVLAHELIHHIQEMKGMFGTKETRERGVLREKHARSVLKAISGIGE